MRSVTRLFLIPLIPTLISCGGESPQPPVTDGGAVTSAASAAASFDATITGAVQRNVQAGNAVSGAKYERYHINLAHQGPPTMVIAFARSDTSTPAAGSYTLDGDGFSGTLDVYADPEQNFSITDGELVITDVNGDALTGTFSFRAQERATGVEISAEGNFQTTGES